MTCRNIHIKHEGGQQASGYKDNLCTGHLDNHKHNNIYHEIYDLKQLSIAYGQVSKKKSDVKLLENLSQSLQNHSYKCRPIRKEGTKEKHLHNIPSPVDKIVQKAMVNTLNKIYEPVFENTSHGFRPSRSTHSALKEVTK